MSNLSDLIVAGTGVAGLLGGGIAWLWGKVERYQKQYVTQMQKIRGELRRCQEGRAIKLTVIELMWQEIKHLAADSPVLDRAKVLLDKVRIIDSRDVHGLEEEDA